MRFRKKPLTEKQIRRDLIKQVTVNWEPDLKMDGAHDAFEGYHEALIGVLTGKHEEIVRKHWFSVFKDADELPGEVDSHWQYKDCRFFSVHYLDAAELVLNKYKERLYSRLYTLERR